MTNIPAKHEPFVSYETFVRIQQCLHGVSHAPARKNLNVDFPLRQFVCCASCDKPLAGCWSKGRNRHHAYYLCQTKGCDEYGKSIRRDVVEGEFVELLDDLRPTTELHDAAQAMFRDLWDQNLADAKARARSLEAQAKSLDAKIEQFVDRVIESNSPTLIKTYEGRIEALETEKAILGEKIANCGQKLPDYAETFGTAFEFLGNPCILWSSER